jgi:putative endonuclease
VEGIVYILTNMNNTVLYTGVTSNISERVKKHKDKFYKNSFTRKYNADKLVWFERHQTIGEAIKREKQIKAGSRQKKVDLINKLNPYWNDLYNDFVRLNGIASSLHSSQ